MVWELHSFDIWDMVIGLLWALLIGLWASFVTQTWQPCWLSQNMFSLGGTIDNVLREKRLGYRSANQNWTYQISRDRQLRKPRANNSSSFTSWRNLNKHYDELAEFLHDRLAKLATGC